MHFGIAFRTNGCCDVLRLKNMQVLLAFWNTGLDQYLKTRRANLLIAVIFDRSIRKCLFARFADHEGLEANSALKPLKTGIRRVTLVRQSRNIHLDGPLGDYLTMGCPGA